MAGIGRSLRPSAARDANAVESAWRAFEDSTTTAPIHTWAYDGIHVWPVIRSGVLSRLAAYHIAQGGRPPDWWRMPGGGRDRVRRVVRKVLRPFGSGWPKPRFPSEGRAASDSLLPGTILHLGNRAGGVPFGDWVAQVHLDASRIALWDLGHPTATFILDADPSDAAVRQSFLPATFGVRSSLTPRRVNAGAGRALRDVLPAFETWHRMLANDPVLGPLVNESDLAAELDAVRAYRDAFRTLLPSEVAGVVLYNADCAEGQAACAAASDRGIPAVEIQHGAQGPRHPGYRWPEAPRNSFNTLPSAFLSWTESDRDNINSWARDCAIHTHTVGHSSVNFEAAIQLEGDGELGQATAAGRQAMSAARETIDALLHRAEHHVLLTTAPGESMDWLLAFVDQLPAGSQLWWRLHPRDMADSSRLDRALNLVGPRSVLVREASEAPLAALLPHMSAHITGFSAVTLEAAGFGVPTIVYTRAGWDLYAETCGGLLHLVANTEELPARVAMILTAPDPAERQGGLARLSAALTELFGKHLPPSRPTTNQ